MQFMAGATRTPKRHIVRKIRRITRRHAGALGKPRQKTHCRRKSEEFSSELSEKKAAAGMETACARRRRGGTSATGDLMSAEEDGVVGGVSGWIVRTLLFCRL